MAISEIFQERLLYCPDLNRTERNFADSWGILTPNSLIWHLNGEPHELNLNDVVGVSLVEEEDSDLPPCLIVNAYPLKPKSKLSPQPQRVLQEYRFTCPNHKVRSQWQQAINNTLYGKPIDEDMKPRHLQVIINSNSGKGQALQILEQVRPLFTRSYLRLTVTETLSGEDTKSLVREMDLATTDGLVVVGGDGTIHDVFNALMSREDWEDAIKTNIGVIPAGSGNGLCKTLLELSKEAYDPLNAAFLIAKGKQQSCDIATVEQNKQEYYSFLSLSWGLISDVDIKSEKIRFFGSLRINIYALMLICLLRTYKGRFSFIPHPDWQLPTNKAITKQGEWYLIEDDFIFIWAMNTAWAAHDMNVTPYAKLNDGAMDVLVMRRGTSRIELLTALLRCGKGQHLSLPHMEYYKVRSFRLEPLSDRGILAVDGEPVDYAPIEMKIIPGLARVNCR